jgi:hypothetical protein
MAKKSEIFSMKCKIAESKDLSDLEKKILIYLLKKSDRLRRKVRLTIKSSGPEENKMLDEACQNLGHEKDGQFGQMMEALNLKLSLSTAHGGWNKTGERIEQTDFSLPGKDGEKFYCSFFISEETHDANAPLSKTSLKKINKINLKNYQ